MQLIQRGITMKKIVSFKVYNTSNTLIKTCILSENVLVYENRYRSKKPFIDDNLVSAESLFLKGEYKKSLDLTLSTIDTIEPGIQKKLLELYDKKSTS